MCFICDSVGVLDSEILAEGFIIPFAIPSQVFLGGLNVILVFWGVNLVY